MRAKQYKFKVLCQKLYVMWTILQKHLGHFLIIFQTHLYVSSLKVLVI